LESGFFGSREGEGGLGGFRTERGGGVVPGEAFEADVFVKLRPVEAKGGLCPGGALRGSGAREARIKTQGLAEHPAGVGFNKNERVGEPEFIGCGCGHCCGGWLK